MGLVPRFTQADVHAQIQKKLELIEAAIIRRLQYLGEQCVNKAREEGSYQDQTSNLRNSIGYVIIRNGAIVDSSLGRFAPGNIGQRVVYEHKSKYPTGWVLIVVAGMNYASYVEARHNKVVLSTAELLAESEMPRMIKELRTNIKNMQ